MNGGMRGKKMNDFIRLINRWYDILKWRVGRS